MDRGCRQISVTSDGVDLMDRGCVLLELTMASAGTKSSKEGTDDSSCPKSRGEEQFGGCRQRPTTAFTFD